MAVNFGVELCSRFVMMNGMQVVTMSHMRMVCSLIERAIFVVLCRLMKVMRGLGVMLGRHLVMGISSVCCRSYCQIPWR